MDLKILVPQLSKEYNNYAEIHSVMPGIKQNYAAIVRIVSAVVNLPAELIYNFIFIESRGQANVKGGQSIGLMQINPQTANYVIQYENISKALSASETALLRKQLGGRLDTLLKLKYTWQTTNNGVTEADLYIPEFNILIGALLISQLIEKTKDGNTMRLDRVIWKYNRGEFSKLPSGDINAVYAAAGNTTGPYILATLGKNGALDYLTT